MVLPAFLKGRCRRQGDAVIPRRRDYYANLDVVPKKAKQHPTDKTLQWDMMLGEALLKWAEQGLRGTMPPITVTFTPKKKRVRPAFERSEYCKLWRTLCKRIKAARDKRTRKSRELLHYYVLVLANSGIRTGEVNNLKARDVHSFKDEKGRNNFALSCEVKLASETQSSGLSQPNG
ncbi:integrase [Bradyrhizobium japonicum]